MSKPIMLPFVASSGQRSIVEAFSRSPCHADHQRTAGKITFEIRTQLLDTGFEKATVTSSLRYDQEAIAIGGSGTTNHLLPCDPFSDCRSTSNEPAPKRPMSQLLGNDSEPLGMVVSIQMP